MNTMKPKKTVSELIANLIGELLGFLLRGYFCFWIWDNVIRAIFAAPVIRFDQTLLLLVLIGMIGSCFNNKLSTDAQS